MCDIGWVTNSLNEPAGMCDIGWVTNSLNGPAGMCDIGWVTDSLDRLAGVCHMRLGILLRLNCSVQWKRGEGLTGSIASDCVCVLILS